MAPWLYLLFIPALSIQLWTDEQQTGLSELLKLLPVELGRAGYAGSFAAWTIVALTLALTFPLVVMVDMLGTVDNSVIAARSLVSGLLAASYFVHGCFMCALSHQRLLTSVLTLSLLLTISGLSSVLDALEQSSAHLDSRQPHRPESTHTVWMIDHGALALHDMLYFISLTIALLAATTIVLRLQKKLRGAIDGICTACQHDASRHSLTVPGLQPGMGSQAA